MRKDIEGAVNDAVGLAGAKHLICERRWKFRWHSVSIELPVYRRHGELTQPPRDARDPPAGACGVSEEIRVLAGNFEVTEHPA